MKSHRPLLLALTLGCYTPTPAQESGAGDDTAGGGSDAVEGGSGGVTASARGTFTVDDVTVFWRWYGEAEWREGTCMEILLRNDGADVRTWQLTLDLDAEIERFSFEDGAFFDVDGTRLVAQPVGNARVDADGSVSMRYCAEPRARVTAVDALVVRE
ncbi:MAG: hypothetical protein VX265_01300 [Myxococcota bacterium]|nr:hypothetical protein [Myxococcota bacterium]MEC8423116.1 hypothetical protein [Myxococcota bacterium]